MKREKFPYTVNISGHLLDLEVPKVMGILNVTPDSFYSESRKNTADKIEARVRFMLDEGVDIIDIGGCSTRPGFKPPSPEEEIKRIEEGCRIIRKLAPDLPVSVDTYRSEVARYAILNWQAGIINDISGGKDPKIFDLAAETKTAYILTHNSIDTSPVVYNDITAEAVTALSKKVNELHRLGVNDVIIDPGFGFAKKLEENFQIFEELEEFAKIGLPLLVGISRKSMIYKTLGVSPEDALTGTIALDAIALTKGANILRVHDVKLAVETIKLFRKLKDSAL